MHYSTFTGPDRAEDMDPAGSAERLGIPFTMSKLADFTILHRNPLDVDSPAELRIIKVLGTVMGEKAFPAGALGKN